MEIMYSEKRFENVVGIGLHKHLELPDNTHKLNECDEFEQWNRPVQFCERAAEPVHGKQRCGADCSINHHPCEENRIALLGRKHVEVREVRHRRDGEQLGGNAKTRWYS